VLTAIGRMLWNAQLCDLARNVAACPENALARIACLLIDPQE
jgi:hypothetical protein